MNSGMIIPQNIGYPAYSNSIPMSYCQKVGSPEKKIFVKKNSQRISSTNSMSTESKIFKPKVSNTQKSHRDSMINKTQINVGEFSMMNQSYLSNEESSNMKTNLTIDHSYQLSQSMIHGRLSPLNLDVSRFEREENSKEIDQVNEQDQEYSHDHYSTQENLNVVAQSMSLNKDDPSTKAASPNSNNILNLQSKKEKEKK